MRLRVPGMSGCPFIQISRMIRSRSSSRCALSSSSADVNTFMLSVRSKRRCRRADRSELVSQSESESLESEDESAGRACFLAGSCWPGWQSVRQEMWSTRAKRVRKRPKHTPQTKKSAALSGWSVGKKSEDGSQETSHVIDFLQGTCGRLTGSVLFSFIFFKPVQAVVFH